MDALEAQDEAGEEEGVARRQRLDEIFLDAAEHTAAAPGKAGAAIARDADVEERRLDDGADVEAILLGDARVGDAPKAVRPKADLGEALIGLERVAAGGDERHDAVESGAVEPAIGICGGDFGKERVGRERRRTGHAENVLGENVEGAGADRGRILGAEIIGIQRRAALHHLEAVGWHQQRVGRLVHAVVGAADALRQAARPLRRADMDDQIDIAPVDAEVEGGGADHGAQLAGRHRGFDLAALGGIERAVVEGDGEALCVDAPQLLKDQLGLAARVDEEQRHAVGADGGDHVGERVTGRVAGPRQALVGLEDGDLRPGTALDDDEVGETKGGRRA